MKLKLNIIAMICASWVGGTLAVSYPPSTANIPNSGQTDKIAITQSHISAGKTYTITAPGTYYLASNLSFVPNSTSDTMLVISSNNVILDLGSKSMSSDKSSAGTVAISISASKSNIHIFNGNIDGMTGVGVKINSGCRNIHVANMSIHNCDEGGVSVASSDHVYLSNCVVNNCNGSSSTTEAAALRLTSSKHVYATNCEFSNNTGTSKAGVGALLSGCTGCHFVGCFANHNVGTIAYGFRLTSSCKDCLFENCNAASQTASAGIASGFSLASSSAIRFNNCASSNNSATSGACYGFNADSTSLSNTLNKCEAMSNAGNTGVHAFALQGNGNHLEHCRANHNSASGSDVIGFYLDGTGASSTARGNVLKHCVANHNSSSAGNASGFLISSGRSNRLVECTATSNTTSAQNKYAAGFDSTAGTNNSFESCVANNQLCSHATGGTSSSTITHYAAGFLLRSSEANAKITNCQAHCNDGGAGEGVGFGIYLRGDGILTNLSDTTAPTNTIVKNSSMEFNTSSGTSSNQANKYGFLDERNDTSSVLINNVSIGHGSCISTLDTSLNFVDPVTTSATNGMNYKFFHTGTDENPANMIHETDMFNWTTLSTSVPDWMNVSIVTDQVASV